MLPESPTRASNTGQGSDSRIATTCDSLGCQSEETEPTEMPRRNATTGKNNERCQHPTAATVSPGMITPGKLRVTGCRPMDKLPCARRVTSIDSAEWQTIYDGEVFNARFTRWLIARRINRNSLFSEPRTAAIQDTHEYN